MVGYLLVLPQKKAEVLFSLLGPGHAKTCLMPYANNKGADQPVHPHSLISTFVVCCLDSIICILAPGFSLQLSDREKFCNISWISGRSLVQILDFPICSIHLNFCLSSKEGEISQLRDFSPKLPPRLSPVLYSKFQDSS